MTNAANWLLTADLHLTDTLLEEYRWDIFGKLTSEALKHDVGKIIIAGDLTDRKDRHSAKLVNNLIEAFSDLHFDTKATIWIIPGNHDMPLNGPYFWDFLKKVEGVWYPTYPCVVQDVVLLPFSSDPVADWATVFTPTDKAIIMHQTVAGCIVEGDRILDSVKIQLPQMPNIPIFSGDVHCPQLINGVTYIGTPHPVRFNEHWDNRILLIKNDDFSHFTPIPIDGIKRAILDISSVAELKKTKFKKADQLRIRYKINEASLDKWAEDEKEIRTWVTEKQVVLASLEALLEGTGVKATSVEDELLLSPEQFVRMWGKEHSLSTESLAAGISFLTGEKLG